MRPLLLLLSSWWLGTLISGCSSPSRDYIQLAAKKLEHNRLHKAGNLAWHNIDQQNKPQGYWLSGVIAARQQNFSWALESTHRAMGLLKHSKDSIQYTFGLMLLQVGRASEAIRYLEMVPTDSFRHRKLRYNRALAYYQTGRWVDARQALDSTDSSTGDNANYLLGCIYEGEHNYRAASEAFDKLRRPTKFSGLRLGRVYFLIRQYNRAIPHFRRATRQLATADSAWLGLGFCYLERMEYARAEQAFKQVSSSPVKSYAQGFLLFRQGKDSLARIHFDRVLTKWPHFIPALVGKAHLLMRQQRYRDAELIYTDALAHTQQADVFAFRGMARFRQFDYRRTDDTLLLRQAKADFRQALTINPYYEFSYDAYLSIGFALLYDFYRQQRDFAFSYPVNLLDAPMTIFASAQKQSPNRAEAYEGMGICSFFAGNLTKASALFSSALSLQPSPWTLTNRGLTRYSLHDYERAKQDFRLATTQNPTNALAWNGLGLALLNDSTQRDAGYQALCRAVSVADTTNWLETAAILFNLTTARGYRFRQSGYSQTPAGFSAFVIDSLQPVFNRVHRFSPDYTDDTFRVQYGCFAGKEYGFLDLSDEYLKPSAHSAARINEAMNNRRRGLLSRVKISSGYEVRVDRYSLLYAPFLPYSLPAPRTDFENRYIPYAIDQPVVAADYLYPVRGDKLLPRLQKEEGRRKKIHRSPLACPINEAWY